MRADGSMYLGKLQPSLGNNITGPSAAYMSRLFEGVRSARTRALVSRAWRFTLGLLCSRVFRERGDREVLEEITFYSTREVLLLRKASKSPPSTQDGGTP